MACFNHRLIHQLLQVLHTPAALTQLDLTTWDQLLPLAYRLGMLGRFYPYLQQQQLLTQIPALVVPHLQAAATIAEQHQQRIRWEVNCIERALASIETPIVLLKGAAYVMQNLACAQGRLSSDVDILLSRDALAIIEKTLLAKRWHAVVRNEYDQQYYRRWAHELPPLRHQLRGTIIDIHHAILPVTARLNPDPELLLTTAQPLPNSRFLVLAPIDIVLHSIVHTFYDGDFSHIVRDLLDLHELLTEFSQQAGFWPALISRAQQLGLQKPLFYGLRYSQSYMHTAVPSSVISMLVETSTVALPNKAVIKCMDLLIDRAVYTVRPDTLANWLLYMRSHWLRMPPQLLAQHLLYKGYRRLHNRLLPANQ